MKIDIPMKRVRVNDILSTYNTDFLEKHNFFSIGAQNVSLIILKNVSFNAIVKTKYGYMAVRKKDYIAYVGDGIWSVTQNKQR